MATDSTGMTEAVTGEYKDKLKITGKITGGC